MDGFRIRKVGIFMWHFHSLRYDLMQLVRVDSSQGLPLTSGLMLECLWVWQTQTCR